jgi:hypothetical protein
MFGKDEVHRFCFRLMDENKNGLVEMDEFLACIKMIQKHSPLVPKLQMDRAVDAFTNAMKYDHRSDSKMLDYLTFREIIDKHPTLTYPVFKLQVPDITRLLSNLIFDCSDSLILHHAVKSKMDLMKKVMGREFWESKMEKFEGIMIVHVAILIT